MVVDKYYSHPDPMWGEDLVAFIDSDNKGAIVADERC